MCSCPWCRKKERIRFIINFLVRCKQTLQNNLVQLKSKEIGTQEKLSKSNYYNFSFFFDFIFSLSWKFWPQLDCEYAQLDCELLYLSMCDLALMKGKTKSSSYGLLTDITLQVECLAPGQNCITCIICTKGKSLKEKERIRQSYTLSYMGTM